MRTVIVMTLSAASLAFSQAPSAAPVSTPSSINSTVVPGLKARLGPVAGAAGKRFAIKGSERGTFVGTIVRSTGTPAPVQIVKENSGKIRVEEDGKAAVGADETSPWKAGTGLAADDLEILESLTNDSLEGFLDGQRRALPTRFLGGGFRTPEGQYLDIYQVVDSVKQAQGSVDKGKSYLLDTQSHLLVGVRYKTTTGQDVEVRLTDFKKFGDETIATTIQRFESGARKWALNINAAVYSAAANDGAVNRP